MTTTPRRAVLAARMEDEHPQTLGRLSGTSRSRVPSSEAPVVGFVRPVQHRAGVPGAAYFIEWTLAIVTLTSFATLLALVHYHCHRRRSRRFPVCLRCYWSMPRPVA